MCRQYAPSLGAGPDAARGRVGGSRSPAGVHPVAEPGPSLSRVKRRRVEVVGDRPPDEGPRVVLAWPLDPLRCGLGLRYRMDAVEDGRAVQRRSRLPPAGRLRCGRGAGVRCPCWAPRAPIPASHHRGQDRLHGSPSYVATSSQERGFAAPPASPRCIAQRVRSGARKKFVSPSISTGSPKPTKPRLVRLMGIRTLRESPVEISA
jgi:hypothetical protein